MPQLTLMPISISYTQGQTFCRPSADEPPEYVSGEYADSFRVYVPGGRLPTWHSFVRAKFVPVPYRRFQAA